MKESFPEAKPTILRARKSQGFHLGNERSWEALLGNGAFIAKTSKAGFIYRSPFLSTTLVYFYPQEIRRLLLSKAHDCKPHKKRPYTKGLLPHPSRIAASITKTSEACFIYQILFLSTTLAYFYPKPMIISLIKNTPTQRAFFCTLPESPLQSQK